jgi:hypothetical protein
MVSDAAAVRRLPVADCRGVMPVVRVVPIRKRWRIRYDSGSSRIAC